MSAQFTEIQPITRSRRSISSINTRTIQTPLANIEALSVRILGPDLEIYKLLDNSYLGVEYRTDHVFEKVQMKIAKAATVEEVLKELRTIPEYRWESERTANIPNRVLEKIQDRPIVTLTRFSAPPIGASSSSIIINDGYDWENTVEYGINLSTMIARVIDVNNKISNVNSYRIRMIEDTSETEGIFQFLGTGLLNEQYAKL